MINIHHYLRFRRPLSRPLWRAQSVIDYPEDMKEAGLAEKQVVHLISHFKGETRTARSFYVVPFPIARHCVATYFPEANVLIPINSTADRSNTPTSKSVIITIESAS